MINMAPNTHQAHYLTRTPSGRELLTHEGVTYRVTRLRSAQWIDPKPGKTRAQRIKELSPARKKDVRLAEKISQLNDEQIRRKLETPLMERRKAELRQKLGIGQLKPEHRDLLVISNEDIAAETNRLLAVLAEFEATA